MPMMAVDSLILSTAGIDVREPLRLIGVAFQVKAGNEGFVAADNDHDQQVGDHHHVDQAEHDQHDVGLGHVRAEPKRAGVPGGSVPP